jgi:large subunit ribosomal protein L4
MVVKVDYRDTKGEVLGVLSLPDEIFGISQEDIYSHKALIHQVVVASLAARRAGTHKVKTKAEVSGGGKKPFKQKGTGNARQGSTRSPQYSGGGVAHGPVPQNYKQKTLKKTIKATLRYSISDRANADYVHVVQSFLDSETPSTKQAAKTIDTITKLPTSTVLAVVSRDDKVELKSLKNLGYAQVTYSDQLSAHDVLVNDEIIFNKGAIAEFVGEDVLKNMKKPSVSKTTSKTATKKTTSKGASTNKTTKKETK